MKDVNMLNFQFVEPGGAGGTTAGLALIWKKISPLMLLISLWTTSIPLSTCTFPPHIHWLLYDSPYDLTKKTKSWKMIENTAPTNQILWIIIGVLTLFTMILKKYISYPINTTEENLVNDKINDLDLIDIGFTRCPFTWSLVLL